MGGNIITEGWRKPHLFPKKSTCCRSKCCCDPQKWRKKKQQWHKCRLGRTCKCIDLGALLRPVNINGKRAPGMRAPRNTTQFLMHEKYQELQKQAAAISIYWQEEGNSVVDYLSHFECSPRGLEQASLDSLRNGEHEQMLQHKSEQYSSSEKDVNRTETFLKRNFEAMYNWLEEKVNSEI